MKTNLTSQRGSAILISLALIVMLSMIGILSLNRANTDVDLAFNQVRKDQAFYAAEAGIQRAIAELASDVNWRKGFAQESVGEASYWVAIYDSASGYTSGDTVVVQSTGVVGGSERGRSVLEAWMLPSFDTPFKYAVFGDSSVELDKNSCTDSYNSDTGDYASTRDTLGGDVASNGKINLSGGSVVGGNASTALAGGITLTGGSDVVGSMNTSMPKQTLDTLSDAEYALARVKSGAPAGLSGSGYAYDPVTCNLTAGASSTITLQGGVYFFNNLTLGKYSKFQIAPGASVVIYLTGNFQANQYSEVNASGDPGDALFYSKGASFLVAQGSEFHGAIYAPKTSFVLNQNNTFYGAVVSKNADVDQGACAHYDRSLSKIKRPSLTGYEMIAWREL